MGAIGQVTMKWIFLLIALWIVLGPLLILFRTPIGRFVFKRMEGTELAWFRKLNEHSRTKSEEDYIKLYFRIGVFCTVVGAISLIVYLLI